MRLIVLAISFIICLVSCSGEKGERHYCSIASLWGYVGRSSVPITEDIYIVGDVLLTDKYGELTNAIVIADESTGVMIELDMEDIEHTFPMQSRVEVCCAGLWLGSVGPKLILGAEPLGEYVVDKISSTRVQNYIIPVAKNSDTPTLWHREIAELEYRDILCPVVVEGVTLVAEQVGLEWTDSDIITMQPVTTVRHFCNGNDTLRVVTDARCLYATELIPSRSLTLTGILDWYGGDIALRITNHDYR